MRENKDQKNSESEYFWFEYGNIGTKRAPYLDSFCSVFNPGLTIRPQDLTKKNMKKS